MSRQRGTGFLTNVSANLSIGASALGYSVIVPAVVVRRFGDEVYGSWYLAFQVAAYIVLLDLGSQYLVTNEASAPSPGSRPARLATAAMALQTALALAVLCGAAAWAAFTGQARLAQLMVVLGMAGVASLLASTVRAWFVGLRRAHVAAAWLVGARVGSVTGLAVAVALDAGLVPLTVAVAAPQLVIHAGLLLWARRPPSPWARPDRAALARLVRSTAPLAVWTGCGIVISGVDIFIVRAVDLSEVGRYAVALPLLAIPTGAVTAFMTAWLPRVARAQAVPGGARAMTSSGTTLMAAALAMGALAFIGYADVLVDLLAGPGQWATAASYLRVLYAAVCLRFVFLPWAILIVVRGDQRAIVLAPIVEGVTNLVASVVLGLWLGAIGVALGTLAGAAAAAVVYLTYGVRRTSRSDVTARDLLTAVRGAGIPVTVAVIITALALGGAPTILFGVAAATALVMNGWWLAGPGRTLMSLPQASMETATEP